MPAAPPRQPPAGEMPASSARRSRSPSSAVTATSESSALSEPPAAASTSTRTRPSTRCSHGAWSSTPRMRSSGTTRVEWRRTPRSMISRPPSIRYVNRRHSATTIAAPIATSARRPGTANAGRHASATTTTGMMLARIIPRAKTTIASGCRRPRGTASAFTCLLRSRRAGRAPRRARPRPRRRVPARPSHPSPKPS